jgi:hypothetical protein
MKKKILFPNCSLFSPVSLTPLINIHSRISPRIFEKFEMVLMGYSGARGTLIYEKNLMSKISCQTPFNVYIYSGECPQDSQSPGRTVACRMTGKQKFRNETKMARIYTSLFADIYAKLF